MDQRLSQSSSGRRKSAGGKIVANLLVCLAFAAAGPVEGAFNTHRLNGDLVAGGHASGYRVSPDGNWVVYIAEQDTPDANELYSVPIQGGTSQRLNSALPSGARVNRYEITPDSRRVIFQAPQEDVNVWELYSVPIQGPASAAVKLNPPLPPGGDVGFTEFDAVFLIAPDGSRVVYHADQETGGLNELYSVPVEGPASEGIKLNPPIPQGGSLFVIYGAMEISPNSKHVVYRAALDTPGTFEIYSVPIAGPSTATVKLNGVMVPDEQISQFRISPDSSRVVYSGAQLQENVIELFSVPIEGPASTGVKLNKTLTSNGQVGSYKISPDSKRVVYRATQDQAGRDELYSVPIAGPAAQGVKLNEPLVGEQDVRFLYYIDATSEYVVYVADQDVDEVFELFSVPIDRSGPPVQLNPSLVPGGDVDYLSPQLSPDGQYAIYIADQEVDERFELYSVPVGGPSSEAVKVSRPSGILVTLISDVESFDVSPDSAWIAYRLSRVNALTLASWVDLYHVPIRGPGSASQRVNEPLVSGGEVHSSRYSPDGTYIIYGADQEEDDVRELFAAYVRAGVKHWNGYR